MPKIGSPSHFQGTHPHGEVDEQAGSLEIYKSYFFGGRSISPMIFCTFAGIGGLLLREVWVLAGHVGATFSGAFAAHFLQVTCTVSL